MMLTYGFSIQGKGHIEKNVVCQDYNMVRRLSSGHYIGIVADGVGSAPNSDVGSKMATEALFDYCSQHVRKNSSADDIEIIISDGFTYALGQIREYAAKENKRIDNYDTTLSAVVYDGSSLIYGHAGDGGIIVKHNDGFISMVTSRQKGADGISVRPLRAGSGSWDFGTVEDAASVLLVTDGMLDGVLQPVLINLPKDKMELMRGSFEKNDVYVTASEFFMNPYSVYLNKSIKSPEKYMKCFLEGDMTGNDQEIFKKCMLAAYARLLGKETAAKIIKGIEKYFYTVWAVNNVKDDKSIVCIMNQKAAVRAQDIKYYEEPDWKGRQERYDALLYGRPNQEHKKEVSKKHKENNKPDGKSDGKPDGSSDDFIRKLLQWIDKKQKYIVSVFALLAVAVFLFAAPKIWNLDKKTNHVNINTANTSKGTDRPVKNTAKPTKNIDKPQRNTEKPQKNTERPKTDAPDTDNITESILECLQQIYTDELSGDRIDEIRTGIEESGLKECFEKMKDKNIYDNNGDDNDTYVKKLLAGMKEIGSEKKTAKEAKDKLIKAFDNMDKKEKRQVQNVLKHILEAY